MEKMPLRTPFGGEDVAYRNCTWRLNPGFTKAR
jgi:hypothetical protein